MLKEMSYGPRERESRGVLENNGGWYNLMRSLREYGKECENLRRNVVD